MDSSQGESKSIGLRVGYLLLAAIFLIVGIAMTGQLPISSAFGVRTSATMADPATWTAVNASTGLLLAFWGWVGLVLLSLARIRVGGLLAFAAATGLLVSLPAISPSAFVEIYLTLASHGFSRASSSVQSLMGPLIAVVLFAAVGNVLSRENVKRNNVFGFRLKALLASDDAWARGNRAGGLALQASAGLGLMVVLLFVFLGLPREALVASIVALALCPLIGFAAAKSINT
jgi:uncharacterized membrane protein